MAAPSRESVWGSRRLAERAWHKVATTLDVVMGGQRPCHTARPTDYRATKFPPRTLTPSKRGSSMSGALLRRFGGWAALAMILAEVMGVGILLAPASMSRTLGSPSWVLGVWA